jgi:hypothetical protein
MPIVIMKKEHFFVSGASVAPHRVFDGTMKQARTFCSDLNKRSTINTYYAVRVTLDKPGDTK